MSTLSPAGVHSCLEAHSHARVYCRPRREIGEISGAQTESPPTARIFFPEPLERVTVGSLPTGHPRGAGDGGGIHRHHAPTRGLLDRKCLVDRVARSTRKGLFVLQAALEPLGRACEWNARYRCAPSMHSPANSVRASGMDDCVYHRLACVRGPDHGHKPLASHAKSVRSRIGMKPDRVDGAFFRELCHFLKTSARPRTNCPLPDAIVQSIACQVDAKRHHAYS